MKFIKIILIIIIFLFTVGLGLNLMVILKVKDKIYEASDIKGKYDFALVLGCGVHKDGKPSKMLKDRLDMAIYLYNHELIDKIIISGTHKDDYSETNVMESYLTNNGISKDAIIVDAKGDSTKESILNYKRDFKDKSVIIITQKYHLYRSLYISEKNDLLSIGVSAKKVRYSGQIIRDIREFLTRIKDVF